MSGTEVVLKVSEIFKSLQGESTYSGLPTIFIRLQGCNLRCPYCDTVHSWSYTAPYKLMTISEVVEELLLLGLTGYICITGGEPLMQKKGIIALLTEQITWNQKVSIETNGSIPLDIDWGVKYVMDWKCPTSFTAKEIARYEMAIEKNLETLGIRAQYGVWKDEVKFVVGDMGDFKYVEGQMSRFADAMKGEAPELLISPIFNKNKVGWSFVRKLAQKIIKSEYRFRLQLQMHKLIWPDVERGV